MPEGSRDRTVPRSSGLRNHIKEETLAIHRDRRTNGNEIDFLGFTHYCSKSRSGRFRVKRRTSKKKFAKKCKEVHRLIGSMRTLRVKEIISKLNEILTGYFHYYGITDNSERITAFRYNVMKSYKWVEFLNMIDNSYPLVRARIYVSVYD